MNVYRIIKLKKEIKLTKCSAKRATVIAFREEASDLNPADKRQLVLTFKSAVET